MKRPRLDPGSTRLAFILVSLVAFFLLLSALIPQRDFAEEQALDWQQLLGDRYALIERLGLDRIYYLPVFHGLLGLLGLNLVFGNIRRFRLILRSERTLLRARHLGSILFHFSLLLVLAGVALNFLQGMRGTHALTEGQKAADSEEAYFRLTRGALYRAGFDRYEIKLDAIRESGESGGRQSEEAEIEVRSTAGPLERATIAVNRPLAWQGLEFHFGRGLGYSPELLVIDEAGRQAFRSFVRLARQSEGDRVLHEDLLTLPDGLGQVSIAVLPDSLGEGAAELQLVLDRHGMDPVRATLAPGDTLGAGGLLLTSPRLRRWCYVSVVYNPRLGLVFAGFWSALAGLAITAVARMGNTRRSTR